jgi:hypothetical protein
MPELQDNKCMLFRTTKFLAICYSSKRKVIQIWGEEVRCFGDRGFGIWQWEEAGKILRSMTEKVHSALNRLQVENDSKDTAGSA